MNHQSLFRAASVGLIAAAALAVACSQANPTRPSATPGASGDNGFAGASAIGDTKVGNGALELIRLRMDRQQTPGVLGIRQFVNPNVAYRYEPGESIELWAEWDANNGYLGTTIPRNPRMYVEWGLPGIETEWTNCGTCRLTRLYEPRGRFIVRVTLDDLSGTRVTRTFILDASLPEPTPTPTPEESPTPEPTPTPTPTPSPTPDTQYTITVASIAAAGGGKGQVTDSTGRLLIAEPSGCGPSPLKSPCSFTVNWGTVVSIIATPDTSSQQHIDFVQSWGDDCAGAPTGSLLDPAAKTCLLGAVTGNKTVTVTFAKDAAPLR